MDIKSKILHWSPRILALLFTAFLFLFSFDVFNEFRGLESIFAFVIHLTVPVIVLLAIIVAWKKDLAGTIAFFTLAIYYFYMIGFDRDWSWYVSILGPLLLTSILFFINWLHLRRS